MDGDDLAGLLKRVRGGVVAHVSPGSSTKSYMIRVTCGGGHVKGLFLEPRLPRGDTNTDKQGIDPAAPPISKVIHNEAYQHLPFRYREIDAIYIRT